MGTRVTFTKQLAAASANCIAQSQAASAGVPLTLNGSASNYLSTTTSAAVAPGGTILPLNSVAGLVPGQPVADTTSSVLPQGTTIQAVGTNSVSIWPPVGGVNGVGNGDTIVFPGTATIDTATAANSAPGRRVVIAYTGTDTNFTIVGTNSTGNIITDVAVGSAGAAQSNLDFVTVTSITPVGGGLTGVTAGTNGVASSPWLTWNWRGYSPMNLGVAVELVSGAVNFTIQYTYDDPNNLAAGSLFPLAYPMAQITGAAATIDAAFTTPIVATRVLINSGTGEIRTRFEQVGAG
jgi:hypothetical protein